MMEKNGILPAGKKVVYWLSTLFIVVAVGLVGGTVDILHTEAVIEASTHLGYPLYFFTLLGIFKILGAIALILPKRADVFAKIAYLGFTFDFIFASFSHYSVGDGVMKIAVPLVFLVVLGVSYLLRNTIRKVER